MSQLKTLMTGYAFRAMADRLPVGRASVVVGLLWGAWHLPVVDYLGSAAPHGTRSLLLAQLIHVSSTGSLVMFGPNRVTPAQEALWYAAYGALLSVAAVLRWGLAAPAPSLRRSSA